MSEYMKPARVDHRLTEAHERIAELERQSDQLLECVELLYLWANNWDSEFMNDPEWKNNDYPFIQSVVASVKRIGNGD